MSTGVLFGLPHLSIIMVVVLQDRLSSVMFDTLGTVILINFKLEKFSLQSGVDRSVVR
jgi:hypothetical protein